MNLCRRLAAAFSAFLLAACASAPGAPAPTAGDCTTIRLWSNGFHANIAMRAEQLGENHPLRALFPDARHFLIGWGERDFYISEDPGFWKGLKAIIPPSPSVIQVISNDQPVEETVWPGRDVVTLAISEAGAEKLARKIAERLQYDVAGALIVIQEGRVEGRSAFLAARGDFHLFNMCNHWTAKRLNEAGVRVHPRISFSAGGLMNAVRRKTSPSCSAGD